MPVRVRFNPTLIAQLRKCEGEVLAALMPVCRRQVGTTLEVSRILAPEGEHDTDGLPPLKQSIFIDGPVINAQRKSVSATAGYDHPAAGAIHEGWHWGLKRTGTPTHFMKKAHRATRKNFAPAVRAAVRSTLKRLFKQVR